MCISETPQQSVCLYFDVVLWNLEQMNLDRSHLTAEPLLTHFTSRCIVMNIHDGVRADQLVDLLLSLMNNNR